MKVRKSKSNSKIILPHNVTQLQGNVYAILLIIFPQQIDPKLASDPEPKVDRGDKILVGGVHADVTDLWPSSWSTLKCWKE